MRILLITDLEFQEAGNQVLLKTVEGFTRAGHQVHIITSNSFAYKNQSSYKNDNLIIHHFRPAFRGIISRLHLHLRSTKSKTTRQDQERFSEEEYQFFYSSGIQRPFTVRNTYNSWTHFAQMISFTLGAILIALRLVKNKSIDLIYGYEVMGIPTAFIISKITRHPCVSCYQGTFAYPYIDLFRKMIPIGSFIFPMLLPMSMVFMENDGTKGNLVLSHMGVSKDRIYFTLGGVNKEKLRQLVDRNYVKKSLGLPIESIVVLSNNKFKYWKRIDRIIRSFSIVSKKIPNAFLILIGQGREEIYLKELAKRSGAVDKILFLGAIPHDQVQNYYAIADVFMITNDVSNLSLSLLEAMTCSQCILSISDGSLDDLLSNGKNALLVNPKNIDKDLPDALEFLLKNEHLRCNLGSNARNTADKVIKDWDIRADDEVKIIENITCNKK